METQAVTMIKGSSAPPLFSRKTLISLLIPLAIEQFLALSIGMADTMMVTSVGEWAVSGVALVDSINILLIQVFTALATGGAVVAAQYLGHREPHNACKAAKQLFYVITGISLCLAAVALIARSHLLVLIFGDLDPLVLKSAVTYLLFTALSYPFLAAYNACAALFRAMGNSKASMAVSFVMNITNVSVNAILIFGCDFGVLGAGIGTLSSRMLGAVIMVSLMSKPNHAIFIDRFWVREWHPDMVRRILRIGVPNGLENGMFQVGKLMVASLIASLGTAAIAADAISNSITYLPCVPGQAVAMALITVVGQCMGAGEVEQASYYAKKLMLAAYGCMSILNIISFLIAAPLVSCFNLSPEAAVSAVQIVKWSAVATVTVWPVAFVLPCALRAAGDAKFTMMTSMFSMWVLRVGGSYLLVRYTNLGILSIWIATYLDWVIRAFIIFFRFQGGKWKKLRLLD